MLNDTDKKIRAPFMDKELWWICAGVAFLLACIGIGFHGDTLLQADDRSTMIVVGLVLFVVSVLCIAVATYYGALDTWKLVSDWLKEVK